MTHAKTPKHGSNQDITQAQNAVIKNTYAQVCIPRNTIQQPGLVLPPVVLSCESITPLSGYTHTHIQTHMNIHTPAHMH